MAEWRIRRRHGACGACEREFEDGERHASLLFVAGEDLAREDLCRACWTARAPDGDDLLWWFTRYHRDRRRTLQLDLASLERLFVELEGRGEEKLRELRYLLCLLLMRKRKLKLARVRRGREGEFLVVRRPRREEELSVLVFDFSPERMDELRTHLHEMLEGAGPKDAPAEGGRDGGQDGEDGARGQSEVADEGLDAEDDEGEPDPASGPLCCA